MEPAARVTPTRRLALRVWWALSWRLALCAALIALGEGFLLGLWAGAFGLSPEGLDGAAGALGLLVGLPLLLAASWECVYRVLGRRLGGVELALVRTEERSDG